MSDETVTAPAASDPIPTPSPRVGRNGRVPPPASRFGQPNGNPKNPGGKPKGFYALSRAYTDLLSWPRADLEAFLADVGPRETRIEDGQLVEVERPPLPYHVAKKIKGSHLIARGMFLSAMSPSATGQARAATEIADRTEGKVTQTHDVSAKITTLTDLVRKLEGDEAVATLAPIMGSGE